jgi:hypothetical protein
MQDVMLDLETMGLLPGSAIVAIGAVAFDAQTGAMGETFYAGVALQSSLDVGLIVDGDTMQWWLKQGDAARAPIAHAQDSLEYALKAFAQFVARVGAHAKVWGNGAAFDNTLLAYAYRNLRRPLPWNFRNDRCYRTLKTMYPEIVIEREGVQHHALDDAISQAKHLVRILAHMRQPGA